MTRAAILGLLLLATAATAATACGGSNDRPANDPNQLPPCSIAPRGPLLGITVQRGAVPTPQGGRIADGVYDLVAVVLHGSTEDLRELNDHELQGLAQPRMRVALAFTTEDRSENHAEGRYASASDIAGVAPVPLLCPGGRFSTVAGQLKTVTLPLEKNRHGTLLADDEGYTATPDTVAIFDAKHKGLVRVFRRR